MRLQSLILILILAHGVLAVPAWGQPYDVEAIFLEGDQVPGTTLTFRGFVRSVINNNGVVAAVVQISPISERALIINTMLLAKKDYWTNLGIDCAM